MSDSCMQLREDLLIDYDCCLACHFEFDNYAGKYNDPVKIGDKRYSELCCNAMRALHQNCINYEYL